MTYVFNSFVVTPTSDINPSVEKNQELASDLLEASGPELNELLLNWNATATAAQFKNSTQGVYYYEGEAPDPGYLTFGNNTKKLLYEEGISYNIEASFSKDNGNETGTLTIVDNGNPGSIAATSSHPVILDNDDEVATAGGNKTLENVSTNESLVYPIPNDRNETYNRVRVRVTVW
jgi:hypothetical protein